MSTTAFLVRHAAHIDLGQVLAGRANGVPLSEGGICQARLTAQKLQAFRPAAVMSSPRNRTLATARIIAEQCGVAVETADALDEIDFGAWTGQRFDVLEHDPRWREWNRHRASACPPGGETMHHAAGRAADLIEQAARQYDEQAVVHVTHCDIIRGVVAGCLGLSLDNLLRFDIDPASITTMVLENGAGRLHRLNESASP